MRQVQIFCYLRGESNSLYTDHVPSGTPSRIVLPSLSSSWTVRAYGIGEHPGDTLTRKQLLTLFYRCISVIQLGLACNLMHRLRDSTVLVDILYYGVHIIGTLLSGMLNRQYRSEQ